MFKKKSSKTSKTPPPIPISDKHDLHVIAENTCICCGAIVPEGTLVCIQCENGFIPLKNDSDKA